MIAGVGQLCPADRLQVVLARCALHERRLLQLVLGGGLDRVLVDLHVDDQLDVDPPVDRFLQLFEDGLERELVEAAPNRIAGLRGPDEVDDRFVEIAAQPGERSNLLLRVGCLSGGLL
jgi:hypothetical protein